MFDVFFIIWIIALIIAMIVLLIPNEVIADEAVTDSNIVPFAEQIKADEERIFNEWLERQEEPVCEVETVVDAEVEPSYLIEVTTEDIDLMARVVMSECSVYLSSDLGTDVAQAIAQTIVNRVCDGRWGTTVSEVINYPNAYSTADNGTPTLECYKAVEAALTYEAFPKDMFYFREGGYHEFGTDYMHIGTTYFSRER